MRAGSPRAATLRRVLGPEGRAQIAALMPTRPLLAFDFDGTLAPIVARPGDANVPVAVAKRLRRLAEHLPVAIVTGRAVADVRSRLGFEPRFVVGNHGAELEGDTAMTRAGAARLDAFRSIVAQAQAGLLGAGVTIEDKGPSIAFHYRLARDRAAARRDIDALLARRGEGLRVFGGKLVRNVMAADAPDKADAIRAILALSGALRLFFAGDDVNDEPVFAAAEPGWMTVRVGRLPLPTRAQFLLDSTADVPLLLDDMLAALGDASKRV